MIIGEGVFQFTCLGMYAGGTGAGVAGLLKVLTDSLGKGHTFAAPESHERGEHGDHRSRLWPGGVYSDRRLSKVLRYDSWIGGIHSSTIVATVRLP